MREHVGYWGVDIDQALVDDLVDVSPSSPVLPRRLMERVYPDLFADEEVDT